MKFTFIVILLYGCFSAQAQTQIEVSDYGVAPNSFSDATDGVRKAIEATRNQANSVLNFPEGRYDFWPDEAEENTYYITNTTTEEEYPSKKQRAGLLFKDLSNIVVEGNHSVFVFHGKMISWLLDNCENVRIQNVKIDYERPGMSELTINEVTPNQVIGTVHPDSKFAIVNGILEWYGEKWVTKNFHAILVDTVEGTNVYSSWTPFRNSSAEVIAPLSIKFTGDFSKFSAQPGNILTIRDTFRDYVGALVYQSKNISLYNVHMNYMQGLGIVSQFSENLHYDHVFVEPAPSSGRVIASSADGMQFSGCSGQITVENCRFKGMHDDAINIHGTHLKVVNRLSPTSLTIRFMHGQSYGFNAFKTRDTVGFVQPTTLKVFEDGVIKKAELISEREMLIELSTPFSKEVSEGAFLENITATPAVVIRNSRFERTNTRGILVTTRRKVLLENNVFFRTGMHAILVENDALGWFESGPVHDLTIRNNTFEDCAYNSFPSNYTIKISPQNNAFLPNYWVHQNITIENNLFKIYDYPILSAKSTSGIVFKDNRIVQSNFRSPGQPRAGLDFTASTKVEIRNNHFEEGETPTVELRKMKKKDIHSDIPVTIK